MSHVEFLTGHIIAGGGGGQLKNRKSDNVVPSPP